MRGEHFGGGGSSSANRTRSAIDNVLRPMDANTFGECYPTLDRIGHSVSAEVRMRVPKPGGAFLFMGCDKQGPRMRKCLGLRLRICIVTAIKANSNRIEEKRIRLH